MKKLASLMGAGALILGMTVPAFAHHHRSSNDTTVRNYARVSNDVLVKADSGDNEIEGFMVTRGRISSGTATALGTVLTDANYNEIGCSDCTRGDLSLRNTARVRNDVSVIADSGDNEIEGGFVGGGRIRTGATYADGMVSSVVNTNIVGVEANDPS